MMCRKVPKHWIGTSANKTAELLQLCVAERHRKRTVAKRVKDETMFCSSTLTELQACNAPRTSLSNDLSSLLLPAPKAH